MLPTLQHVASGHEVFLNARCTVGRSATCNLRLDTPDVSAFHAQIFWDGHGWQLRDMNSRNGTYLQGKRLAAGEQAPLDAGAMVYFGTSAHRYLLVEAGAPRLMAVPSSGPAVVADTEVLCLPSSDACDVSIFLNSKQRWVLEDEHGERPLEDQQHVTASGLLWRVCLPLPLPETRDFSSELQAAQRGILDCALHFQVSRDGEHVIADVTHGSSTMRLEFRVHLLLLLELARARLADAAQEHLPASEHGWVYRDELLKTFDLDLPHLNIWLFRARQQLAKLNIRGAGSIFERRVATGQLRIGISKLCIAT